MCPLNGFTYQWTSYARHDCWCFTNDTSTSQTPVTCLRWSSSGFTVVTMTLSFGGLFGLMGYFVFMDYNRIIIIIIRVSIPSLPFVSFFPGIVLFPTMIHVKDTQLHYYCKWTTRLVQFWTYSFSLYFHLCGLNSMICYVCLRVIKLGLKDGWPFCLLISYFCLRSWLPFLVSSKASITCEFAHCVVLATSWLW